MTSNSPDSQVLQGKSGPMATNRIVDELVVEGAQDWVMAAEVAWLAKSLGDAETDEEILDVALRAIRAVVEKELMQIGDVTDGGFFEWELTPEESLVRVQR